MVESPWKNAVEAALRMSVISGIILYNVELPGVIVAVSQFRNSQQVKLFRS